MIEVSDLAKRYGGTVAVDGLSFTVRPRQRRVGEVLDTVGLASAAARRMGLLTRHTAGAIAALFALVFLIPQVIHAMQAPWDTRIGKYMLDNAGQQMSALHGSPGYFSPGVSLIICLAYAAVALTVAAFVITRRDA